MSVAIGNPSGPIKEADNIRFKEHLMTNRLAHGIHG